MKFYRLLLALLLAASASTLCACSNEKPEAQPQEKSSNENANSALKDYVRDPLENAEDVSKQLESRNDALDEAASDEM